MCAQHSCGASRLQLAEQQHQQHRTLKRPLGALPRMSQPWCSGVCCGSSKHTPCTIDRLPRTARTHNAQLKTPSITNALEEPQSSTNVLCTIRNIEQRERAVHNREATNSITHPLCAGRNTDSSTNTLRAIRYTAQHERTVHNRRTTDSSTHAPRTMGDTESSTSAPCAIKSGSLRTACV
jgi:hypothetical protein